jgi:hypothetical protein
MCLHNPRVRTRPSTRLLVSLICLSVSGGDLWWFLMAQLSSSTLGNSTAVAPGDGELWSSILSSVGASKAVVGRTVIVLGELAFFFSERVRVYGTSRAIWVSWVAWRRNCLCPSPSENGSKLAQERWLRLVPSRAFLSPTRSPLHFDNPRVDTSPVFLQVNTLQANRHSSPSSLRPRLAPMTRHLQTSSQKTAT